ncbi:urease accessory protein UreF [Herpetosiphon llansteffanensis]|uniref:urease accessory protein UreF n=1 Tax=Herpetosiphon llansteffanensis TaxID=2094568 RepID=UPI000D7D2032|nr:urease accessory UreF family protein [Herpetosiphon llansteffanensis]
MPRLGDFLLGYTGVMMSNAALAQLKLLQLADSALPIGTTAHSYGVESLVAEGQLGVAGLGQFLRAFVHESGQLEAYLAYQAWQLGAAEFSQAWLDLNAQAAAFKPARESRHASAVLGRRLLSLALQLEPLPRWQQAITLAQTQQIETHHSCVFGLVAAGLAIEAEAMLAALLQQMTLSLILACQKILPLGQVQAQQLLWQLHPSIQAVVAQTPSTSFADLASCSIGLDGASMRHPLLGTRLFIS